MKRKGFRLLKHKNNWFSRWCSVLFHDSNRFFNKKTAESPATGCSRSLLPGDAVRVATTPHLTVDVLKLNNQKHVFCYYVLFFFSCCIDVIDPIDVFDAIFVLLYVWCFFVTLMFMFMCVVYTPFASRKQHKKDSHKRMMIAYKAQMYPPLYSYLYTLHNYTRKSLYICLSIICRTVCMFISTLTIALCCK